MATLHFKEGDYVILPAHGVGRIHSIESQLIDGDAITVFVIHFLNTKLTMRLPIEKARELRKTGTKEDVQRALKILRTPKKEKKKPWIRRSQAYTDKIHSGLLDQWAHVIRDLYHEPGSPFSSFSERNLFEKAFSRFTHEMSIVEDMSLQKARQRLFTILEGGEDVS